MGLRIAFHLYMHTRRYLSVFAHTHMHTHVYIYVCKCKCAWAYVSAYSSSRCALHQTLVSSVIYCEIGMGISRFEVWHKKSQKVILLDGRGISKMCCGGRGAVNQGTPSFHSCKDTASDKGPFKCVVPHDSSTTEPAHLPCGIQAGNGGLVISPEHL